MFCILKKNVKVQSLSADTWVEYNRLKGTTVKIDRTSSTAITATEMRPRTSGSQPATRSATEVHLSELAGQLQSPGEASTFDAARVSEIKQAIAEGRFTINSGAIADRLIASASELVASSRQA